ncbi:flagellar biosynthetic protein FliR [Solemya pervernicosa gill symbiont]|uniref:Flagellar biosynthetic protein FliR n=1 Tax=Solemya pervernicosa gill symbiont TaxID=642797 RepID=A0A1T2LB05_9GAMM|nr:flagellar biosynthetic protein FliR [Solemya pervernicosa gill symbiont]OOZ42136.1 flagellar biosynthetic protein FliR [Solemya pervernicosa gill symbiont]
MNLTTAEIGGYIGTFMWPFVRIGAMFTIAPIFGSQMLPMRVKLLIAVTVTLVLIPVIPAVPNLDPLSPQGIFTLMQQFLIGFSMGFVLQLVMGAITMGGHSVAMGMGLGFASMVDPQNGVQVPVLSQYFLILTTLLFLSLNGHLIMIDVLAQSFHILPVGTSGLLAEGVWGLVQWGGQMFAGAVLIAMPVMISLMVVNIGFGVMMRAAPQLNIFAVGFPITMLIGFVLIMVTLPTVADLIQRLFDEAFNFLRLMLQGGT